MPTTPTGLNAKIKNAVKVACTWGAAGAIAFALSAAPTLVDAGITGFVVGKAAESSKEAATDYLKERMLKGQEPTVELPPAGSFAGCSHLFPRGTVINIRDISRQWMPTALCFKNFAVLHSGVSKTPLVVVERLNREILESARNEGRTNQFYPDPRLPRGQRAELQDYVNSNLDRGHMASAADQPDAQAMEQSFALSNMIPQDPENNRKGAWFKAEVDTRKYARRAQGDVFVFSGPLFRGPLNTIGAGKVWVPSHLYKLVVDASTGRSWAFIIQNTADARLEPPMNYPAFARETGWNLLSHGSTASR